MHIERLITYTGVNMNVKIRLSVEQIYKGLSEKECFELVQLIGKQKCIQYLGINEMPECPNMFNDIFSNLGG